MYNSFFDFKERPFQLVPNPAYLYLSKAHEEALAHLTYAVSQGDGFVEITGEVGTGKTTLCRVFLEQLDSTIEAAYIFNPMLSSVQLLQAINDEFGIPSDAGSTKALIDRLNEFLLEKKSQGKRVIILIDEAQNLNMEVLEQLRLLSNLETTTSKLLQIILVGQPELREKLDSHELRQLSQRITLSCHLTPLNLKETSEYIQHRVRIAAQKSVNPFTRSAVRVIYQYSGGTPRLINIACDRMLLTAYGLNKNKISGAVAKAAIRELATRSDIRRRNIENRKLTAILLILLSLLVGIILLNPYQRIELSQIFKSSQTKPPEPLPAPSITVPQVTVRSDKPSETPPVSTTTTPTIEVSQPSKEADDLSRSVAEDQPPMLEVKTISLEEYFKSADSNFSKYTSIKTALSLWGINAILNPELEIVGSEQTFFRLAAKHNGMQMHRLVGTADLLKKLDLPTIMEINAGEGLPPYWLTLYKIKDGRFFLDAGHNRIETNIDELRIYWFGVAYIPWKNFFNFEGKIPGETSGDAVITLKMLLKEIGFQDIPLVPEYDEPAKKAVETIQSKNGIPADGVVGPLTRIILYNELKTLKIPHITE